MKEVERSDVSDKREEKQNTASWRARVHPRVPVVFAYCVNSLLQFDNDEFFFF
jgi:hypothetical protein